VWTWKDANLNFTSVMFNMYPVEQVVEIEVFDSKGTKFAHLNNELRAAVGLKGSHRSMPYFWNRLTVTDGALMLTGIQMEDNGLEIRAEWHLTPLNSRPRRSNMESVRVKTIRVLVNDVITSQGNLHLVFFSASLIEEYGKLTQSPIKVLQKRGGVVV